MRNIFFKILGFSFIVAVVLSVALYANRDKLGLHKSHYEIRCISHKKSLFFQKEDCDRIEIHCVMRNNVSCPPVDFMPKSDGKIISQP